jgi:type I restriction enzyme S subunit
MAGVRLDQLCDLVAVQVDPARHEAKVYVGLEHVASGRFTRSGHGSPSDVQSSKFAFRAGDVLYGKLRPYLDKAVLTEDEGICTTELLVLRPKADVDPRFLVGVVHSPSFVEHAVSGTTGVQHPRTSWQHISSFELPDFRLDEKKAIGGLLWKVHDGLIANEQAISAGDDLKRAAMRALFTKGLRGEAQKDTEIGPVPESWDTPRVGECVLPFRFERNKQIPSSAYGSAGRWPIVDQGQGLIAGYTDAAEKVIEPREPIIIFGDHTRVFKFIDFPFALGADGTKPLTAASDFEAKFLFHTLSNLDVPSRGYNRHYTVLAEMQVPCPPTLDEQREIVAVLDAIDRKIGLHKRKRAVLEELFKSLLHKLMTGEIRVADLDLSALETAEPEGAPA